MSIRDEQVSATVAIWEALRVLTDLPYILNVISGHFLKQPLFVDAQYTVSQEVILTYRNLMNIVILHLFRGSLTL
jgi:hypothetical protein